MAAALAGVLLAACTGPAHNPNPRPQVTIGLLAALSGPSRPVGQEAERGAELAAVVVNQAGAVPPPLGGAVGLGGATLRIVSADSAADPNRAADQAARLVTAQHVVGLVGADTDATVTAAASERTERLGVPLVAATASASYLTERGMDWFFRTGPSDRLLAEACLAMLDQMRDQTGGHGLRRLGIVHANDAASNDTATAVQTLAGEAGDQIAATTVFQAGDVRSAVRQVRARQPAAVLAAATRPADATALLATGALAGGGSPVTIAIGAGFAPQTIQQVIGPADAGVLRSAVWSRDFAGRNPAASAVAALYAQRFDAPMTETAAEAFTATLTLAQAIGTARSADPQQVRTALLGLDIPGRDTIMPWGGIRFDQTGQNVRAAGLVERVARNGAHVVFPRELATGT